MEYNMGVGSIMGMESTMAISKVVMMNYDDD